jgi:hypothetical protein
MATTPEPEESAEESRTGGSDQFKLAVANLIGGNAANTGAATTLLAGQWISLHNADPGATGANEISTGTGRQKVTWGAAASDNSSTPPLGKITGNELTFSITGTNTTVSHYGVWSAVTAGTFLYGKPLSTSVTLTAAGTVKITPTHAYGLKA